MTGSGMAPLKDGLGYSLKVIGGHNFSEKKCLFSLDGKFLLAISGQLIRIHYISNGSPYGILEIGEDSKQRCPISEEITNIVLDPSSPDSSFISFTNFGRVTFWNYISLNKTKEYNIFSSLYPNSPFPLNLLYGLAVGPENVSGTASDLTLYYATLAGDRPFIYFCTIGQLEETKKSNKSKKSKSDLSALEKMKLTATNIRYDPERALVGIVIGARNKYLAAIEGRFINIIHLPYSPASGGIAHKQARNNFTCLTAHPKEMLLAAGDDLGRVFIYREDFCYSHHPIKSITHWHHSPVNDLCFSPSGSYLYSGGYESVLVRWDVTFSHDSNFYPRLGSPIRYVICDNLNQRILTCHEDNTFNCISSTFDSSYPVIDGLTLLPPSEFLRAPYNISWDPKSSSLVLRGKCGHLQFYSPSKEKQICQLDVVNMNFLPPEVDKVIINVDVVRFCVSPKGDWISTLEYRADGIMLPEMRLKFWQFIDNSEVNYKLNTCIHLPHKNIVNSMRFSRDANFLITTSKDTEFKIWHLIKENDSDKANPKIYWICDRVGNLNRASVPEEIAVSSDFSLLAISFDSNTTIWDSSDLNLQFKGIFIPPKDAIVNSIDQNILSIEFGTESDSHLFFETRSSSVRVWDLLTLTVVFSWKPPKNAAIKFSLFDETTSRIACYTTNGAIHVLNKEKEIGKINLVHDKADVRLMVCGIFFPLPQPREDKIFSQQGIILLDQSQKVYAIGLEEGNDQSRRETITEIDEESLTPYARMLKNETLKMKKEDKLKKLEINDYLGPSITRRKLIEDVFINVPSHVLPPVERFCASFLTSLLQLNSFNIKSNNNNEVKDNYNQNVIKENDSSEEESDDEIKEKKTIDKGNIEMDVDDDDYTEKPGFFFEEDYDWLKLV